MTESTEPTPQAEPTKFTRLRTSIIIVSMIAMPLFAVIGVKMPKFLSEKANESAGVTNAGDNRKAAAKEATKPGGAQSESQHDTQRNAPRSGLEKSAGLDRAVSLAQAEADHPFHNHAAHNHFAPTAGFASPASLAASNTDVRAGGSGVSQAVALESMRGNPDMLDPIPVGFDTGNRIQPLPPLDETARSIPAAGSSTADSSTAGSGDQFSHIQSRLKALGATHYTLETWGTGGNSFRFQCRMAAGHSADYTRQFEATDTEPLRTMQTVLDEVEAWKAGRLP